MSKRGVLLTLIRLLQLTRRIMHAIQVRRLQLIEHGVHAILVRALPTVGHGKHATRILCSVGIS